MKNVSVAQVKNTLTALLRETASGPIEIRRNDRPAAVLLSIETYRRLVARDKKRTVLAPFETIREAGGLTGARARWLRSHRPLPVPLLRTSLPPL